LGPGREGPGGRTGIIRRYDGLVGAEEAGYFVAVVGIQVFVVLDLDAAVEVVEIGFEDGGEGGGWSDLWRGRGYEG